MNLNELNIGEFGKIVWVSGSGPIRARLMDMGLVRGTIIEVMRHAPMNGPIEIKIKGTLLSLRSEEAAMISVIPVKRPTHQGFGHHMGHGHHNHRGPKWKWGFMSKFFTDDK
jgi:Fe2+ transport system protein FeoA